MVIVQLLQFTWACRSRWIARSAVATMVWSTEDIMQRERHDGEDEVPAARGLGRSATDAVVRCVTCSATTHDTTLLAERQLTVPGSRKARPWTMTGRSGSAGSSASSPAQLNSSSTGAGLTPSQASVLGLIVARGPLSLSELSEVERLNPTMLSRVVSKLHGTGSHRPDPGSGRPAQRLGGQHGRGEADRPADQGPPRGRGIRVPYPAHRGSGGLADRSASGPRGTRRRHAGARCPAAGPGISRSSLSQRARSSISRSTAAVIGSVNGTSWWTA